jgi:hypothetical protein
MSLFSLLDYQHLIFPVAQSRAGLVTRRTMIPRFLRTFLIISTLIILTTLYVFYPLHTKYQRSSTALTEEDGIAAREDHWDKGGLEPVFNEGQRVVDWNDEDDRDELGITTNSTTPSHAHSTERISLNNQVVEGGGVIMSRLGNATAKLVQRQHLVRFRVIDFLSIASSCVPS